MDAPDVVQFGKVEGYFIRVLSDGSDEGETPDAVGLNGTVNIKASITSIKWAGLNPPVVAALESVSCPVWNGYLCAPGTPNPGEGQIPPSTGVWILSTDQVGSSPESFTYTASFVLEGITNQLPPVQFALGSAQTVHLGSVVPVSAQPGTVNVLSDASSKLNVVDLEPSVVGLVNDSASSFRTLLDSLYSGGGSGTTDHGALTGLLDDDHTQYHTDARGDVRYYTQAQVDQLIIDAINGLVDGAPGALDTLAEFATAINNDDSFAATVTTALAGKAPLVHGHVISDITDLQAALDAKATSAQGAKADTAVQPAAIANMVTYAGGIEIEPVTRTAYDAMATPRAVKLYLIDESA